MATTESTAGAAGARERKVPAFVFDCVCHIFNFDKRNALGPPGEMFDEVRVSRSIRYTDDFEPATQPFEPDDQTYLLMHLDRSCDTAGGVKGGFAKASKLKDK